ncbi:MAG: ATP F0F1 synthase subunit B [Pseudomonadota bacterium]
MIGFTMAGLAAAAEAAGDHGEAAAHHGSVFSDPTFWVAISFILFIGTALYLKVHQSIASGLDKRAEAIRDELEQAEKLKVEAQNLLATYQRKQRDAEAEAQAMLDGARAEAEAIRNEMQANLKEMIDRRTAAVEAKVEQMKANAVKDVRAAAADVATAAARRVLAEQLTDEEKASLNAKAIDALARQLH